MRLERRLRRKTKMQIGIKLHPFRYRHFRAGRDSRARHSGGFILLTTSGIIFRHMLWSINVCFAFSAHKNLGMDFFPLKNLGTWQEVRIWGTVARNAIENLGRVGMPSSSPSRAMDVSTICLLMELCLLDAIDLGLLHILFFDLESFFLSLSLFLFAQSSRAVHGNWLLLLNHIFSPRIPYPPLYLHVRFLNPFFMPSPKRSGKACGFKNENVWPRKRKFTGV